VLECDIKACFDEISHTALMDRLRARIKDKRICALVKAFLKSGVLTELGDREDTLTGTPQGGILSPLIFNVAMSALDEHLMAPWKPGGPMSTPGKRTYRRSKGAPTWRIIRYADDFVILVNGTRSHTQALREDVAAVLEPLGLRLSPAKTQVVHMSDGFDFLGFRIRWKRKRGSGKWYVYTFIADRPVQALKAKIRALTHRTSQQDLAYILTRLGQIMRGWANYFRYAVAKWTFSKLDAFTWWRLARMLRARHRWNWGQLRRHLLTADGRWRIAADGVEYFRIQGVAVSRYPYRGNKIPSPWPPANPA
jgi:RNA-directed DNA polymerase